MKKILILTAILFAAFIVNAQTDPIRIKLDSIFQNINKAQIPTGYLKEYGAEMMPLHMYNGILTDSNIVANIDGLRTIYTDLATAKIQSALPAMPATLLLLLNK